MNENGNSETIMDIISCRKNDVIQMIRNVDYHKFIACGFQDFFSPHEFTEISTQLNPEKFVNKLIEKSKQNVTIKRNIGCHLAEAAKECHAELLFVLLFEKKEIPNEDERVIYYTFIVLCMFDLINTVEITDELLNHLIDNEVIAEACKEEMEKYPTQSGKLWLLISWLPYSVDFYPKFLFALFLVNQTGYIDKCHHEFHKEIEIKREHDEITLKMFQEFCNDWLEKNKQCGYAPPPASMESSYYSVQISMEPMEGVELLNDDSEYDLLSGLEMDGLEVDGFLNHKINNGNGNFELPDLFDDDELANLLEGLEFTEAEPEFARPVETLKLRKYQEELAQSALKGKNTIIVAPTNSGKTHIAMHIVQKHIETNAANRVLFVLHRVNLLDQQYDKFCKYLGGNEVAKVLGGKSPLPLTNLVQKKRIVILMAQCLQNALLSKEKPFDLHTVSLLVFDECHNCVKGHPYNMIMDHYHRSKQPQKLPIIVGLTASPGTGKANNPAKAYEHLLQMCANFNCHDIDFISEDDFKSRLAKEESHEISITEVVVIPAPMRTENRLGKEIIHCMKACESALKTLKERGAFKPEANNYLEIPSCHGKSVYTNFIGNLDKVNEFLTTDKIRPIVECFRRYLDFLNRALVLYHLLREQDVADYLKKVIKFEEEIKLDQEQKLRKCIQERILHFRDIEENPCLETLKCEVLKQMESNSDSRVLIFVRERHFALCLQKAFEEDVKFMQIPVSCILGMQTDGHTAAGGGANNNNAMPNTPNWQRLVMDKFKDGQYKILFATTVAEEGLDVVKCNLVIRYDHVTNEIAMVQAKGRARAGISKYILIYQEKEKWIELKEEKNHVRNAMMIKAVQTFEKADREQRSKMINQLIQQRNVTRDQQKPCQQKQSQAGDKEDGTFYIFRCKKCSKEVCSSKEIKLVLKTNHVCTVPNFRDSCHVVMDDSTNTDNGTVYCPDCRTNQKWGMLRNLGGRSYIILNIENFFLKSVDKNGQEVTGAAKLYKKWKDVPFQSEDLVL